GEAVPSSVHDADHHVRVILDRSRAAQFHAVVGGVESEAVVSQPARQAQAVGFHLQVAAGGGDRVNRTSRLIATFDAALIAYAERLHGSGNKHVILPKSGPGIGRTESIAE